MTKDAHWLECCGYRVIDEGRDEDGRYCVLAKSCGHFVIGFAHTRDETYSAVCDLALRLTMNGELRLPFRRQLVLPHHYAGTAARLQWTKRN